MIVEEEKLKELSRLKPRPAGYQSWHFVPVGYPILLRGGNGLLAEEKN